MFEDGDEVVVSSFGFVLSCFILGLGFKDSRSGHDSNPFSRCLSNPESMNNSKSDYPFPLTPGNKARWLLGGWIYLWQV